MQQITNNTVHFCQFSTLHIGLSQGLLLPVSLCMVHVNVPISSYGMPTLVTYVQGVFFLFRIILLLDIAIITCFFPDWQMGGPIQDSLFLLSNQWCREGNQDEGIWQIWRGSPMSIRESCCRGVDGTASSHKALPGEGHPVPMGSEMGWSCMCRSKDLPVMRPKTWNTACSDALLTEHITTPSNDSSCSSLICPCLDSIPASRPWRQTVA